VFVKFGRTYSDKVCKNVLDGFKNYLDWLISSQASKIEEGSSTMALGQ
jgi:hypothetical protein